ncbi:MAG: short-chain fatty acid transporter [Pelovirga sp.]
MFKQVTNFCVRLVQRYLPDPFLFCIILTLLVFIGGITLTQQGPMDMIIHWNKGFWNLLAFSMQMVLVLVTGHTLAHAPIFQKGLQALARPANTPTKAILAVTFVSLIACLINWGFGLVIGALYARQLAREVKGVDYRLLIASAYSGFIVWHAGISGSIPLTLATAGLDLAGMTKGAVVAPISTSLTIFAPFNIAIVLVLVLTLPFLCRFMHPDKEETVIVDKKLLENDQTQTHPSQSSSTPADWLENSPLLSMLIGAMGLVFIIYYFAKNGFQLNLNIVNFIFLFCGILLHGTPRRFLNAITVATKGSAGIILQFPFYAGIMGMMVGANAAGFSLAGLMSNWFVDISNPTTFPLFSFLSAGLVNFFVPSGGGQWAVQAPIMMPAGEALGVPAAKTAMAIAWGDAWTNMIQPFWALPALGIAGLGARDIMGYCLIVMFYSGVIISLGLILL